MNKRTRTIVLYGLLTAAVAGTGGLAYGAIASSGGSSSRTATRLVSAQLGTVSSTVSATGTVQPATSLDLNFTNSGVLSAVYVKAGEQVTAGQKLAAIEDAKAKVGLETAQANLGAAKQKLADAKSPLTASQQAQNAASLASAQQQVEAANQTLANAKDAQAAAQAQVAVNQAATNLASTKAANDAKAVVDPVAVAQAQAAVDQAALTVDDAEKALAQTTLTAPVAGTITAVNFTLGQTVSGGATAASSSSSSSGTSSSAGAGSSSGASSSSSKAFATLVDLSNMVVKVGFAEADAGKVAVGQPATITVDTLTGQRLGGKVAAIDTLSTVVSNVVTYNALVTFDEVASSLKPGVTANVSVVTSSKSDVVSIPSAAIQTRGGSSQVTVVENGKQVAKTVEVGLKGDGSTEIASGLSAGEQVVMSVGVVSAGASSSNSSSSNRTGTAGAAGGFGGPPVGGLGGR